MWGTKVSWLRNRIRSCRPSQFPSGVVYRIVFHHSYGLVEDFHLASFAIPAGIMPVSPEGVNRNRSGEEESNRITEPRRDGLTRDLRRGYHQTLERPYRRLGEPVARVFKGFGPGHQPRFIDG